MLILLQGAAIRVREDEGRNEEEGVEETWGGGMTPSSSRRRESDQIRSGHSKKQRVEAAWLACTLSPSEMQTVGMQCISLH